LHGGLVFGKHPRTFFFRDGCAHALAVRAALLVRHQLPAVDVGIAIEGRRNGRFCSPDLDRRLRGRMRRDNKGGHEGAQGTDARHRFTS
jgi:hypothetical protein